MINEDLKWRIEAVAAHFAGNPDFKEIHYENGGAGNGDGVYHFRYLPTYRKTYLGTYLNPFSLVSTEEGKPLLWSDEYAEEYAEVSVTPVYRHNGTSEDVSVRISVTHIHASVLPLKGHFNSHTSNSDRYRRYAEIVAAESPNDYVANDSYLSACMCGSVPFSSKIGKTAKERAIGNAVAKAMESAKDFVPRDWSAWAQNPEDYHADTTAECDKWRREHIRKTA